jgi:hypothetical protein
MQALHLMKTAPVIGRPGAELAIGTEVEPVALGQSYTYEVDVGNVGAASLQGTEVVALLPPGATVGAISDGGALSSAGRVVWNLGAVPVAAALRRTVTVTSPTGVPSGTLLQARAFLTYEGGNEVDAVAEHVAVALPEALPLDVSVAATPSPAVPGQRILYTATITNTSARSIDGIALMARVPRGLQYHYTTDADPDSANCGNSTCSEGEEGFFSLGSLAPGASALVSINPMVAATLGRGSLIPATQYVTAANLEGTITLQKTVATQN